jgi:hypothetical protein
LETEFFTTFFGSNKAIIDFAKFLLLNGHRNAAQELNKVITLFGVENIESNRVIQRILDKYNIVFEAENLFNLQNEIKLLRFDGFSFYLIAQDFTEQNIPIPNSFITKFNKWTPELVKIISKNK